MSTPLLVDDAGLRARLLACGRRRAFGRNEVVYHAGDPGSALHLVHRGQVALRVDTPRGDRAIIAVLAPGQVFGEGALLADDHERDTSAVALVPTETFAIHRHDVEELARTDPAMSRLVLRLLAAQVTERTAHLVEALCAPAEARILHRLVHLAAAAADNAQTASVHCSQADLAAMSGSSRATANRVLRELVARGIVHVERNRIDVLDRPRLVRHAG